MSIGLKPSNVESFETVSRQMPKNVIKKYVGKT